MKKNTVNQKNIKNLVDKAAILNEEINFLNKELKEKKQALKEFIQEHVKNDKVVSVVDIEKTEKTDQKFSATIKGERYSFTLAGCNNTMIDSVDLYEVLKNDIDLFLSLVKVNVSQAKKDLSTEQLSICSNNFFDYMSRCSFKKIK